MSTGIPDTPPYRNISGRIRTRAADIEWTPAKIAGAYLLFGLSFLVVSDVLLVFVVSDPLLSRIQAIKGTVEIVLTAGLIYALTWKSRTDLKQENANLRQMTNLITMFTRVLRHNIRNDMTVIRSWVDVLADRFEDDPESADTVIETVDDLVELSEKARQFESIVQSDVDRGPVDITAVLESIATQVTTEYPSATVTVERDRPLTISAGGSLRIALEELIENAAKHAGESPTVTVSADRIYWKGQRGLNGVEIRISDDGPGLPASEQQVLEDGVEDPLSHGSGIGLYMVDWIVRNHGGTIEPTVSDEGTTLVVTLPESETVVDSDAEAFEQLFKRAQDRFKTVFEESFHGMVVFTDDGRIVEANPRAAELHGLPKAELLGRSIDEFIGGGFDFERDWPAFYASDRTRGTVPLCRPDGTERVVEYATTTDIVPGQHLTLLRDVTEREERERRLELAETIFQNTQDAIFLATVTDGEYRFERGNDAYEALTGRSTADIQGESLRDVVGDSVWRDLEPRYRECVECRETVQFEQEIPVAGEQRHWNVKLSPVVEDDAVVQVVGALRDVTAQKRRQRELRLKSRALEAAPIGVTIADATADDDPLIYVNDRFEELTGYAESDVLGRNCRFLQGERTAEEPVAQLREALDADQPVTVTLRNYRADGTAFWNTVSVAPVRTDSGDVTHYVGFQQDLGAREDGSRSLDGR